MADVLVHPDEDVVVAAKPRLREPGGRGGLVEVYRSRVIVQMLARRDVRLKYRYSSIGFGWAYVRPTIQFLIYYFIVGIVLGIERRVEHFAVYVFSGLCLMSFYNETVHGATRSITKNRAIVKKVWLPREIFPVAGILVAFSRFVPQFIILMAGATISGWYFTWLGLGAAVMGVAIVAIWGIALGLILAAVNVYVREVSNVLEMTGFLTHWLTPMVKPWTLVKSRTDVLGTPGAIVLALYIYNPLCTAIELFHQAFWMPTINFGRTDCGISCGFVLSPHLWVRAWIMLGVGILFLAGAQAVFRRMQVRFAEEL